MHYIIKDGDTTREYHGFGLFTHGAPLIAVALVERDGAIHEELWSLESDASSLQRYYADQGTTARIGVYRAT